MSEIKITVEIPGLPEAINKLTDAICSKNVSSKVSAPVEVAATQQNVAAEIQQIPTTNPVSTNTVSPVVNTPSVPAAPAHSEAATNYTIEQLSVAGAALCEQGKMAQLIALLGKYGVQAVTQLKPTSDVLNPFAAELKALGANL